MRYGLAATKWCASVLVGLGLFASLLAFGASAAYPERPVRIVVPVASGTANDTVMRMVAERLSKALGSPVVIENRPGANTAIGAQIVATAPPDGYLLLAATNAFVANAAGLLDNVQYNPVKDFTPIGRIGTVAHVLLVQSTQPWKTITDVLSHARTNPGKLNAGVGTTGSILFTGMLKQNAGVDIVSVPYQSAPATIVALLSGQVDMVFADMVTASVQLKAGKMRPLDITSLDRSRLFPDSE